MAGHTQGRRDSAPDCADRSSRAFANYRWVLALVAAFLTVHARADILAGIAAFDQGDFAAARNLLQQSAELGDARAQFAIGAMLVKGQGGDKDVPRGLGWLLAAVENGYSDAKPQVEAWRTNVSHLSPENRARMEQVLAEFGSDGIRRRLMPVSGAEVTCSGNTPVGGLRFVTPGYPNAARRHAQNAVLYVAFEVGTDGLAREPEVLTAFPPHEDFEAPAIKAILSSRFRPAEFNGRAVDQRAFTSFHYEIEGGGYLWSHEGLSKAAQQANAGSASAQRLVGEVVRADRRALGFTQLQAREYIIKAAQAGEPRAQYWVGQELDAIPACGYTEQAELWLRAAARNDEPSAQVRLARMLLARSPTPAQQEEARQLLVSAIKSASEFAARQAIAVLATSPYDAVRDARVASSAGKAIKIDAYAADPQTWDALAVAAAAGGDFWQATHHEERAIKLTEALRLNTGAMQGRLESFRAKSAWRGDFFAVAPVNEPLPVPVPEGIKACGVLPLPFCYVDIAPRKPPPVPFWPAPSSPKNAAGPADPSH